jgi:hypothetical protein
MVTQTIPASCLCGDVRWEVDGPLAPPDAGDKSPLALLAMSHCHCSRCRKAHGAPFSTYLVVPEEQFRLTHGHERIVRYESLPGAFRPFCGRCGSVVPDGMAWNGHVGVPAGPFDADPGITPTAHIFVASKAPWVTINDDLARFDAYPESFGAPGFDTRPPLDPDTGAPRGSCLCGAVTYLIVAPPLRSRTCHCSRCRKAGSAAHVSYLAIKLGGVLFTRGDELIVTYKVPEARFFEHAFCRVCGSSMPRASAERKIAIVPMGSLDDDPGIRPESHIFVGSRAAWDVITDALPQHEENV